MDFRCTVSMLSANTIGCCTILNTFTFQLRRNRDIFVEQINSDACIELISHCGLRMSTFRFCQHSMYGVHGVSKK